MTETLTTVNRRPQYIEEREQLLLDKIFGTATTGADGVTTYTGGLLDAEEYPDLFKIPEYNIAPQTDAELSALGAFDTAGGRQAFMDRAQPYFTDAQGKPRYLGEAGSALGGGYDQIMSGINSYFPTASQYIQEGRGGIDAGSLYDSELADARSATQGGLGEFDPSTAVSNFMNPYKQQVIDEAMSQIDRQGAQAMTRNNASAVGAGAFGGARQGVQAAETERNIADSKNKTISNMLSAGYDQSLKAAMTADETARKRQLDAGKTYGQMGLSSAAGQYKGLADEKTRSMEAGRLYGGLGQTVGGLGSKLADVGSSYGSLAGTGADIGRVYSAMAPADLGFMYNMGSQGRGYDQSYLDNYRRNQMRTTDQALYPVQYGYGALSGTPSASMSSQYNTQPVGQNNPFVSGIGAYTAMQGINQS